MLATLVASGLITLFGLSFSIGLLSSRRTRADEDATTTWRNIVHRNAITEPIPFASSVARVNAPGLVQVHPRRSQPAAEQPTPIPTHEPVRSALPAPVSVETPPIANVSPTSAAQQLPMKFADEPNDEERETIMRLWERGRSMTAIILSVWGIKSGGSERYALARARYKFYLAEARSS